MEWIAFPLLFFTPQQRLHIELHGKSVFRSGKDAFLNLLIKRGDRLLDQGSEMCILLDKTWHEFFKHAQKVVSDQDLAVTEETGTDADGRHGNGIGNHLGQLGRNTFKYQSKDAGIGQGPGIAEQTAGRLQIPALDPVTA